MKKQLQVVKNQEVLSKLDENSILIDVREVYEYNEKHIPQAVNMPLGEIEKLAEKLDKNKTYYIICKSGRRSEMAAEYLIKNGFNKVYNVLPGMMRWK